MMDNLLDEVRLSLEDMFGGAREELFTPLLIKNAKDYDNTNLLSIFP